MKFEVLNAKRTWKAAALLSLLLPISAQAQALFAANDAAPAPVTAPVTTALPDAPSATLHASLPPAADPQPGRMAPRYAKYIASYETAQSIDAHDKVIIGARDLYSPTNFLAIITSAGYSHLTNGQPNYGTDRGAFGQRLGAAAIRETSQGVFTDMVFSPMLHMDPRYYGQGSERSFVHRTVYAVSRVFIGRTDGGRSTINAPLLLGYAATSAMTPLYYPSINRNFRDVASGYGGSLGGAAIGFLVGEFSDQFLQALHMHKKP